MLLISPEFSYIIYYIKRIIVEADGEVRMFTK